jgi:LysM repeat protein
MRLKLGLKGVALVLVSMSSLFGKVDENLSTKEVSNNHYLPYTYSSSIVIRDNSGQDNFPILFEETDANTTTPTNYPIGFNSISFDRLFFPAQTKDSSAPLIDEILELAIDVFNFKESNNTTSTQKAIEIVNGRKPKKIANYLLREPLKTLIRLKYIPPLEIKNRVSKRIKKDIKKIKLQKIEYIVKKGDTFIKLARDFNTTVFDIKNWNGIENRDLVRLDEKLIIYPDKKTPYKKIKLLKKLKKYGRYRVQPGDTLSSIVKKFNVSKKETIELNELKSSDSIIIGQKLVIPLTQQKIDLVLKKIEAKKRAKRLELERKRKLEMARKGRYQLYKNGSRKFKRKIRVVATAYTSHRSQTDNTPFLAAWNNRIRPGMKVIAVSNDLIRRYGITNGTRVRISGLPGVYVVRDKMHPRLRNHIDIYMGTNISKALRWGRRRVILYW